jgi:hypothetical protein
MFSPVSATALDIWISSLLIGISHAGAALVVGFFLTTSVLAMHCDGCCSKDEIFRHHVF